MKKCIAFILLLCHMNASMFLPQVPEEDVYDTNGQQVDDINSVIEFVRVELGYDKTADDEDDDSGQNFHLVKALDYAFEQQSILIEKARFAPINGSEFSEYKIPEVKLLCYDILIPPPKVV